MSLWLVGAPEATAADARCGESGVLCARVEAGSSNEFVVEVLNRQEGIEHDLRLEPSGGARFLRGVHIEPRAIAVLEPGRRADFTVRFEVIATGAREAADEMTLSVVSAESTKPREEVSVLLTIVQPAAARPETEPRRGAEPPAALVTARDTLADALGAAAGAAAACAEACQRARPEEAQGAVDAIVGEIAALSQRRPPEVEDLGLAELRQARDEAEFGRRTAERAAASARSQRDEACRLKGEIARMPAEAATLAPRCRSAAGRAGGEYHEADEGHAVALRAANRAAALAGRPATTADPWAAELAAARGRLDAARRQVEGLRAAAAEAGNRCAEFANVAAAAEAALAELQHQGGSPAELLAGRQRLAAARGAAPGCSGRLDPIARLASRVAVSGEQLLAMEARAASIRGSAAAARAGQVASLDVAAQSAAAGVAAAAAAARLASAEADQCAASCVAPAALDPSGAAPPGASPATGEDAASSGRPGTEGAGSPPSPGAGPSAAGGGWDEALGSATRTASGRPAGEGAAAQATSPIPQPDIESTLAAAADAYAACDLAGAQGLLGAARAVAPLDPRIARLSGLIAQQSQAAGLYNAALQAGSGEQALGLLAQADAAAGAAETSPPCLKSRIADARTRAAAARTRDRAVADEQRSRDAWRAAAQGILGTLIPLYNAAAGGGAPALGAPVGAAAPVGVAPGAGGGVVAGASYCHIQPMPRSGGGRPAVTLLMVRSMRNVVQYAVHEVPAEDADAHAAQWGQGQSGFSELGRYSTYDAAHAEAHRRCPNPVAAPGF